jgi:hypothetical protein
MDVESSTSPSKKRSSSPPAASSATKRVRVALPEAQLTVLNGNMQDLSKRLFWQGRMGMAVDDKSQWQDLFSDVLIRITRELAVTSMKDSVISPKHEQADDIVKNFNDGELEEWKVAVRKGVEENDWTDLIGHRMYILDHRMVGSYSIITTAKLKKTRPTLGVPIKQRMAHFFLSCFTVILTSSLSYAILEDGMSVLTI